MSNNRRKFLQRIGVLGTAGLVVAGNAADAKSTDGTTAADNSENFSEVVESDEITEITILQTTDVHCQVHPHDELFWENGKAVFRITGVMPIWPLICQKSEKPILIVF